MAAGQSDGGVEEIEGVPPQISVTPGMPERKGVARRQARVREILHTLPPAAQEAILEDLAKNSSPSASSYASTPDYGD
jgi:phospholipid/cholesterol/gamma-HCH transport system ATP-binding protein